MRHKTPDMELACVFEHEVLDDHQHTERLTHAYLTRTLSDGRKEVSYFDLECNLMSRALLP